ncbi:MAG: hypothetical protein E7H39_12430 [Clostridium sp.]|nr:hypothetical protein [Clostridium sp.]
MKEYIKTTISRDKLYERNYTRDSIVKIKLNEEDVFNRNSSSKVLIDILTHKYLETKSV